MRAARCDRWLNRSCRAVALFLLTVGAALTMVSPARAATASSTMAVSLVISASPCTVSASGSAGTSTVGVSCPSGDAWRVDSSSVSTAPRSTLSSSSEDVDGTLVTITW